ncbi:MAG: branched-chain amino acid ABC transporter permease [Deltaproteobacteria bacterium]|nr:branched-chain amino acid ABC transporter permease [Deltaproteobacteria bacterium]MBW1977540.1 branched-chain amino acid ABC transporter permease [Deltaproteobacteria bacterium]MBW2299506.1 branched-chain amino acid ABC transporter permease [Deltaproteobacteria bacterium]RLB34919.1 MAG: branched-chain amino acid ABC transporter permease [Deltaproteobacteria bacterium]
MELTRILQILSAGLIIGGIYALIAVGLNLIYGTMRLLNIAHGELIMLGAYVTYWLYTLYGVSPLISMILVSAFSALIGLIVCWSIFLPIIKTSKSAAVLESNSLLIFFGLSVIFSNLASLLWTADIRGYSYMTKVFYILGVPLMHNRLLAFLVAVVVCILSYLLLQKTMLGKAIRALIQDREASQLVGINARFIYIFSFCLGFAMAGLAGCLLSMFYEITPFMGLPYTIVAFIVIVLGGLGNIFGSLMGGFLLGLLETIGVSLTSPGLRPILSYSIFILIILVRPKGIFGRGVY